MENTTSSSNLYQPFVSSTGNTYHISTRTPSLNTTQFASTQDYQTKYFEDLSLWRKISDTDKETIAKLRSEVDALKKALEGFVGVTI